MKKIMLQNNETTAPDRCNCFYDWFLLELVRMAKLQGVTLKEQDFVNHINEEMLTKLEAHIAKYSLVRDPKESAESYFIRIVKNHPEILQDKETMLGIASVLQREKTYEIFNLGN